MEPSRPIEEQTVKALSWQLLYGNYRSKLGAEGWENLSKEVSVPDFRKMDQDEDCPMEPFNRAVTYIDTHLGNGDGALVEEITVASVDGWASIFRNLVQQLQSRPQKMMEIFCTEVHPYFLNDPGASLIVESAPDHFILRLDNGLLEGFKTGLIRGFCDIVGAESKIEKRGDEYHVSWEIRTETPEPSRWALFINATRAPFLTATAVPALLGTAIAWKDGSLNPWLFLATFFGVILSHLGINVLNDYFDHVSGADEANLTPTPFSGGSRLIQRGLLSANNTLRLALGLSVMGGLLGFVLVAVVGWQILIFGLIGFAIGYVYTAPPFRLAYRGFGEIAVGIGFGPVTVMGSYWVQTQQWSNEALLASIIVGLLITAVLYINEISDRIWDDRAGKRTVITRLSQDQSIRGYAMLVGSAYLVLIVGVVMMILPVPTLLGLATIPMAWSAYKILRRHHAYPYRLIPANGTTIFMHLLTGLLMFSGYIVAGFLKLI
jgi:1,4-dihydroxy-2-naphthoate octaprenyltransferase